MKNRKYPRALLFSALVLSVVAAAASFSPASSGQGRRPVQEDVSRLLHGFDQLRLNPSELLRGVRKEGALTLRTSHGAFEMALEPFDIRADNYRAVAVNGDGSVTELERTPSRAFRGTVRGVPGSQARFILDEGSFEGVIVTPGETFFVEPAGEYSEAAEPGEFVFYAASAVKESAGECGATLAERVGAEAESRSGDVHSASKGFTAEEAFAPKPVTEVATESDFEFTSTYGGADDAAKAAAANEDIRKILTMVHGVYEAQLGIQIAVVFQRAFPQNNDPYTATVADAALTELRTSYANSPPSDVPARDLVHLFTGKTFVKSSTDSTPSSTIGIAYISAVCDAPAFSYGISQSKFNGPGTGIPSDPVTMQRVSLTAHEMGHNFGASHPNQETPVPPSCNPSIMNSSIQATDKFCQFSLDQITNHVVGTGGSCLARNVQPGCTYSLSTDSQFFSAAGGEGSVGVSSPGGCEWAIAEGADWISVTSGAAGSGTGAAGYAVAANTGGPRAAIIDIAGQKLTVKQAAAATCSSSQMAVGQNTNGSLDSSDCRSGQPARPNAFIDLYTFAGRAGQRIRIEMNAADATTLDTFLYLFGPDGTVVAENDDIVLGSQTNSRLPVNGFFTLPRTGLYTIEATSYDNNATGAYTLTLSDNSATSSVSFTSGAYSVGEALGAGGLGTEGSGFRVVTVTRSGSDVSGTATVNFATSDVTAERLKDYEQALGTLVFGPHETSKSFTVFVNDDVLAEGNETVSLTLSNTVGTSLGANASATLTIESNDAASATSPARAAGFSAPFFVRQQYLDFFTREPDAPGFAFWQNTFNECGSDAQCQEVRRIYVSAAFFLSIEFQETGYLVHRFYKSAYGDAAGTSTLGGSPHQLQVPVVRLEEFLSDTQRIGQGVVVNQGDWQGQLEANKRAFALEFVLRPRFLADYPASMPSAQFVEKLLQKSGVTLSQAERDQLVAQLNATPDAAAARASVLRQVAENAQLRQAEYNRAFVLMQYFGYLRRNPNEGQDTDYTGYEFWLGNLNRFNGNYIEAELVKAFITSEEYVKRFGN